MSSSRALCCLPSVKKQKHDFQVCFVDRARHRKNSGIWLFTIVMSFFQLSLFIAIYFLNQPLFNFFSYCLMLRLFCQSNHVPMTYIFLPVRNKLSVPLIGVSMYNNTIIRFGFCDIHNNQGLGKTYQPQHSALTDNTYLNLDYFGYH